MCSGPVSVITELGPRIEAIGVSPAAEGATSGGAVRTVLTAAGSLTITSWRPLGANVTVNASPRSRKQRSISTVGATAQISVCTTGGILGPGGNRLDEGSPISIGVGLVIVLAMSFGASLRDRRFRLA